MQKPCLAPGKRRIMNICFNTASTVCARHTKIFHGCKSLVIPLKHITVLGGSEINCRLQTSCWEYSHCSSLRINFQQRRSLERCDLPTRCSAFKIIRSGYADRPWSLKFHYTNHFMSPILLCSFDLLHCHAGWLTSFFFSPFCFTTRLVSLRVVDSLHRK